MADWFWQNIEWLLSGILVTVPLFVAGYWLRRPNQREGIKIKQKSGRNSRVSIDSNLGKINIGQRAKGSASAEVKNREIS